MSDLDEAIERFTKGEEGYDDRIEMLKAAFRTSKLERENAVLKMSGITQDHLTSSLQMLNRAEQAEKQLSSQHDNMQRMVETLQLIATDIGSTHAANKAKEVLSTLKSIKPYV